MSAVTPSPWAAWRAATPARLALGRAGNAMPTAENLRLGSAHGMARDAVHAPLDTCALATALTADGWSVAHVTSCAPDRATYLRRPDLGRQLDGADAERLRALAASATAAPQLCVVVSDGLSSVAAQRHAVPLLQALRRLLPDDFNFGPVVIATQARVALADDVGEALGARLVASLIGERPGLSSPHSLGVYLTLDPRRGRRDAERNCISNVQPDGLSYEAAAFKLAWHIREALARGVTGVALKDESDLAVLDAAAPTPQQVLLPNS